jgi:hypothetical protein
VISRTYDAEGRIVEGGQTVRRDGMVLRSTKEAGQHVTGLDSHHVVPGVAFAVRKRSWRDRIRDVWNEPIPNWLACSVIVLALIALALSAGLMIGRRW